MSVKNGFKIFLNGLLTGLLLQLAIGPVFFFIMNLVLQKSVIDGFIAVIAVSLVDYLYIIISIAFIGKLFENSKVKHIFGVISSFILIIFGVMILKNAIYSSIENVVNINTIDHLSSFFSVFLLTISSPLTIFFFTSVFTVKTVEYNYTKKELIIFGFSVGLATLLFMGSSVIIVSIIKESIPLKFIWVSNLLVGIILIGYGMIRIFKIIKQRFISI